jgi:hypothetical protein
VRNETPVNVARRDVDDAGRPVPGGQHVVTLGTPDERLAWYAAVGSRSRKAIKGLGVLDGYGGHLHDAGRGHRIPAGVVAHPVPQRAVPSVQAAIGPPPPEVGVSVRNESPGTMSSATRVGR